MLSDTTFHWETALGAIQRWLYNHLARTSENCRMAGASVKHYTPTEVHVCGLHVNLFLQRGRAAKANESLTAVCRDAGKGPRQNSHAGGAAEEAAPAACRGSLFAGAHAVGPPAAAPSPPRSSAAFATPGGESSSSHVKHVEKSVPPANFADWNGLTSCKQALRKAVSHQLRV